MKEALSGAIFPGKCLSCGGFIPPDRHHRKDALISRLEPAAQTEYHVESVFSTLTGAFLCAACADDFMPAASPMCTCCGMVFKSRQGENHLCGDCTTEPKHFTTARAFGIYDRTLMNAVHALKYHGKTRIAHPLGQLLFLTFCAYWDVCEMDVVVPVPLHISRFRERGFNQSFLLIKNWYRIADAIGCDISHVRIEKDALVRSRRTAPQTGLGRQKRKANIHRAFSIPNPKKVRDKRVLLIDDVYTTGATVDECSKILLTGGGATRVDVLTLARAV